MANEVDRYTKSCCNLLSSSMSCTNKSAKQNGESEILLVGEKVQRLILRVFSPLEQLVVPSKLRPESDACVSLLGNTSLIF